MRESYSQILRSLTVIGGSSALNIAIGLFRTKVAAIILGPAGLGYISILQGLLGTATAIFSLGLNTAGTRKIAEAAGAQDAALGYAVRRALFLGAGVLACAGCATIYLCREMVARIVLADPSKATDVGYLALGIGFTVYAGAQSALLNGRRRIGDMARIAIWSAVISAVIGISAIYFLQERGVLIYVLATPAATLLLGHLYTKKLPEPEQHPKLELFRHWKDLSSLGLAFMLSGLAGSLAQLAVRTLITRQLGNDALGQFQAAWTIGLTYIGFVLTAMGTDFYARLAATNHDHQTTNRLVNQQAEVALLIAGPLFLVMLGFTPWIVQLLYSSAFSDATQLLRWQILGDALKVASWPLGFILLVSGNGRNFLLTECFVNVVFVLVTWIGLPLIGINAAAAAVIGMYAALLPIVYALARLNTGFRWESRVFLHLLSLLLCITLTLALGFWSELAIQLAASVTAVGFAVYGLGRLDEMTQLPARLAALARRCRLRPRHLGTK